MKKVVYGALAALVAVIAYKIGGSEGDTVKDKTINFGLNAYAKGRAVVEKLCPGCFKKTPVEPAPEDPVE